MTTILGIDPSMTSTGVAIIKVSGTGVTAHTHRVESKPPKRARGDKTPVTLIERHHRLELIAEAATCWPVPFALDVVMAIIEGPSYSSAGAGTWDRAWLWGTVVAKLHARDIPVVLIPPSTRAKWATGSGAAGKSPVGVHMSRMWPDIDPGITDDEWDALALASMGAQHIGWLATDLARHREQLDRITWPEMARIVVAS